MCSQCNPAAALPRHKVRRHRRHTAGTTSFCSLWLGTASLAWIVGSPSYKVPELSRAENVPPLISISLGCSRWSADWEASEMRATHQVDSARVHHVQEPREVLQVQQAPASSYAWGEGGGYSITAGHLARCFCATGSPRQAGKPIEDT